MQGNLLAPPWTSLEELTALPQPLTGAEGLAAPLQGPHSRSLAPDSK